MKKYRKMFDEYLIKENDFRRRLDTSWIDPIGQSMLESIRVNAQGWIDSKRNSPQTLALNTMPYVHFDFIDSMTLNASAFTYQGIGFIGIHLGAVMLINDLFERMMARRDILPEIGMIDFEDESPEFLPELTNDFSKILLAKELGVIKSRVIPKDPIRRAHARLLADIALQFLVAHELAHIRYGHTDLRNKIFEKSSISESDSTIELWCAPYLGPLVKLDNGLNLDPYERQDQAQVYRRLQAQSRSRSPQREGYISRYQQTA